MSVPKPVLPSPSAEEQKSIIKQLDHPPKVCGETRYIIAKAWLQSWKKYVLYDISLLLKESPCPGPINNTPIITETSHGPLQMKKGLYDGHDYESVSEEAWKQLFSWYRGGPPIPRSVIEKGYTKRLKVEVHLLCVRVIHNANPSLITPWHFSAATPLKEFKNVICSSLEVNPAAIRIFNFDSQLKGSQLLSLDNNLEIELSGRDNRLLLFEQEGIEMPKKAPFRSSPSISSFQRPSPSVASSSWLDHSSDMIYNGGLSQESTRKGVTGLRNLGNTCYMNATLQCLSNAVPFRDYVMSDNYVQDINETNPMGTKGEIGGKFAKLIFSLWSDSSRAVTPTEFRYAVGKYSPMFSGYQQHDAHEFLSFLLNSLHEDLSRKNTEEEIKAEQPSIESPAEAWAEYVKRNQSIVMDLFLGQFRSTLSCSHCSTISITYDPFLSLSLPLPSKKSEIRKILLWSLYDAPVHYALPISHQCPIKEVKHQIQALAFPEEPETSLLVVEVANNSIYRIYTNEDILQSSSRTIMVFKMKKGVKGEQSVIVKVQAFGNKKGTFATKQKLYAHPFVIQIHRSTTLRDIYLHCWERLTYLYNISLLPQNEEDLLRLTSQSISLHLKVHLTTTCLSDNHLDDPIHLSQGCTLLLKWKSSSFLQLDLSMLTKVIEDPSIHSTKEEIIVDQTSLSACYNEFTKGEKLGANDLWFCPSCKKSQQATKTIEVQHFPSVLVIHLKRFQNTSNKLNTLVSFKEEGLDLSPNAQDKEYGLYDLFAVCNHMGSLRGGHYTAMCKNEETGGWYLFNDCATSETSFAKTQSSDAYILFYRRRKQAPKKAEADSQ